MSAAAPSLTLLLCQLYTDLLKVAAQDVRKKQSKWQWWEWGGWTGESQSRSLKWQDRGKICLKI